MTNLVSKVYQREKEFKVFHKGVSAVLQFQKDYLLEELDEIKVRGKEHFVLDDVLEVKGERYHGYRPK